MDSSTNQKMLLFPHPVFYTIFTYTHVECSIEDLKHQPEMPKSNLVFRLVGFSHLCCGVFFLWHFCFFLRFIHKVQVWRKIIAVFSAEIHKLVYFSPHLLELCIRDSQKTWINISARINGIMRFIVENSLPLKSDTGFETISHPASMAR